MSSSGIFGLIKRVVSVSVDTYSMREAAWSVANLIIAIPLGSGSSDGSLISDL